MQFFVYDPNWDPETAVPPSPEVMAEMGKLEEEAMKAGWLVSTGYGQLEEEANKAGGLASTGALPPKGTRLRLEDRKFTVTDGPFIELKELTGGFGVVQAQSLEEAIELSKHFQKLVGDGESMLVPLNGRQ